MTSQIQEIAEKVFGVSPPKERKKAEIHIKELLYVSGLERIIDGRIHLAPQYNLYSFRFANGRQEHILVVKHGKQTPLGDYSLYLEQFNPKQIEVPERDFVWGLVKKHFGGVTAHEFAREKTIEEMWFEVCNKLKFFTPALPLTESEISALKTWTPSKLETNLENFLGAGITRDSRLTFIARGISVPQPEGLPHEILAPNTPHVIISGQPNTGKTRAFRPFSDINDTASRAGLAGFSTADASSPGALTNTRRPQVFDDMQELDTQNKTALLNIMDGGIYTSTKGCKRVTTKSCAPLIWIANPPAGMDFSVLDKQDRSILLIQQAERLLKAITTQPDATGRRLGLFFYDPEMMLVTGCFHEGLQIKAAEIEESINELIQPQLTVIYQHPDIRTWLQEREEKHKEELLDLAPKFYSRELAGLCRGLAENFPHSKGLALKESIRDHLSNLLNNKIPIVEILESAKDHLTYIQTITKISLRNLLEYEPQATKDFHLKVLNTFRPEYGKFLMYGLLRLVKKCKEDELKEGIPLEEIRAIYPLVVQEQGITGKYAFFSNIIEKINFGQLSRALDLSFGVTFFEVGGIYLLKIQDFKRLNALATVLFKDTKTETSPPSKSGETGGIGGKLLPLTQKPQGNEGGHDEKQPKEEDINTKNKDETPKTDLKGQVLSFIRVNGVSHSIDIAKGLNIPDQLLALFEKDLLGMVQTKQLEQDQQGRYYA